MVSNRKLQSILKQTQQKHYDLKKRHSKCEEKQKEMKNEIQILEQKVASQNEKCAQLNSLQENYKTNQKYQKEIANLAQRIEQIDRENCNLRKDKEMHKLLTDKQNKKIRELNEIIDKYKQLKYINCENEDEIDYQSNIDPQNNQKLRSSSKKQKKRGSSQK